MPTAYTEELTTAIAAVREAGAVVLDLYERSAAAAHVKKDGSPVTDADLAADHIIRAALTTSFPADSMLTEESTDDAARLHTVRCWIVDPIDGTKQFIERTGEFDVLIALVINGRPVLGVAYQPTTGLMLSAVAGSGAWIESGGQRRLLRFQSAASPPRLTTSIWFGGPDTLPVLTRVTDRLGADPPIMSPLGVYGRKFVPPNNPADAVVGLTTSLGAEWDFAATDVIIHEAGGRMTDIRGQLHRYNKENPRNCNGVVAAVDPATHQRIVEALRVEYVDPAQGDDFSAS